MSDENPVIYIVFSPLQNVQIGRVVVELFTAIAPATTTALLEQALQLSGTLIGSTIKKIIPGLFCELHLSSQELPDEPLQKSSKHIRGSISVSRKGPLHGQSSSALMICFAPLPSLDGHHLVIGHVIEGMESLTKIERYGSLPLGNCTQCAIVTSCGQILDEDEGL